MSGAHPASCTKGTGYFLGVKSGRGVTLTPHSLLVPWSRKGRAIPLTPLWAVQPVPSLSACTRVHFTFSTCKVGAHNVQVRPNLLYLVVETWVIMIIVAQNYVDHAPAALPGRSRWWPRLQWIPWSSSLGLGRGAYDFTSCKTLLSRNTNRYCCPEDGSH